jgi:hypothetical protein
VTARVSYPKDPEQRKAVENADYIGWWAGMMADLGHGLLVEINGRLFPIADLVIRERREGGLADLCIVTAATPARARMSPSSKDAKPGGPDEPPECRGVGVARPSRPL